MAEQEHEIQVRVLWGSKSSGGKWGYRAIEAMKRAGGTFNANTKLWSLPADTDLPNSAWRYLEVVE